MENMVMSQTYDFWKNKKVFLTGHTGFKGSWLALWLSKMGAKVCGYALAPLDNDKSLFNLADVAVSLENNIEADIRDLDRLSKEIISFNPDIVIHMAAQALVRYSYSYPVETYEVNVLGTVNILQSALKASNLKAFINITSDKCYENKESFWGYRENDAMGGYDPYSSSKGCAELVTQAYRQSFYQDKGIALASARAGNVIGGGDFSVDRLIPDIMQAYHAKNPIVLRYPNATRPWQHVLESLSGYLLLAQKLYSDNSFSSGWNFGPSFLDVEPVINVVKKILYLLDFYDENGLKNFSSKLLENISVNQHELLQYAKTDNLLHEAHALSLDCTKARVQLNWLPRWDLNTALIKTVDWYENFWRGSAMQNFCLKQIQEYEKSIVEVNDE